MKIKELMMKIRFSHIMCICIGVLIPIYCDVLFLHGFDSGTVSAIMDTSMAIAAIYTIMKVKDWYADKINEKGFEHANSYITMYHEAKLKANLLHLHIENLYNYLDGKDLNTSNTEYQKRLNKVQEIHTDYRDHLLKLNSNFEILRVWNIEVHPDKKEDLKQSIGHLSSFVVTSNKMICICEDVSGLARKKTWEFHNISFKNNFALTQFLPSEWLTSWKNLFVISKSTTTNS
jgi:hypothetical protein